MATRTTTRKRTTKKESSAGFEEILTVLKEAGVSKVQMRSGEFELNLEFQVHGTLALPATKQTSDQFAQSFLEDWRRSERVDPTPENLQDMRNVMQLSAEQKKAIENQLESEFLHDNYRSSA